MPSISTSIYDDDNEKYLRSIIENEDKLKSSEGANKSLDALITPSVERRDIREIYGGKNIPMSILTSRGLFYPKDLVITAFPLKVNAIRHFSSIDENDGVDVDVKLRMVMNETIKVQSKLDPSFTTGSLLEIDRLFLLFMVRSLTFIDFPAIINSKCTCSICNNVDVVDIKAERIGALKKDSLNTYLQQYSEDSRSILWGYKQESIPLWLPSCDNLTEARTHLVEGESQDKFMLCFLVPPSKKLTKSDFDSFEREIDEWSADKYMIVRSFVKRVNESYSVDLYYKCSSCGAEVTAPLQFQRGIRELFVPEFSD